MIKDLLLDDFPIVRTTAVIGTCIAMSVNWELFPEEMLRTYFKIIVNDLSCDSSSSDVRCAVAKGLKVLLENPLTLPTLQGVLPKVQGLFHDISDSVRIAFCQLLLRVKKISAIKYFDIVPLDHLLARLEEDTAINKLIVTLIHNSYFPQQEMAHIWMARCLELIKTDRGASRILFQYVPSDIGIKSTVRFMGQCLKTIHTYIKAKISAKNICTLSSRRSSINKAIRLYEEMRIFDDPSVVAGVLDAVVIMYHAISSDIRKPENKERMKELVGQCTKYLGDLSIYYKDSPEWRSIYLLSSFMPACSVPTLGSLCFYRLKTLPSNAEYDDYITLLECLCNQGQGLQLLNLIQEWVEVGLLQKWKMAPPSPLPSKRRNTRGSRKSDSSGYDSSNEKCEQDNLSDICEKITSDKVIYLPKPELSAQLMNAVLNSYVCQKSLLKSNWDELKDFLNFTDILKKKIEESETKLLSSAECTFLKDLLFALLTIAVLLHGEV
ncbi:Condensin-2 complex subunit G2, partial [Stegodyphus mimosarum]